MSAGDPLTDSFSGYLSADSKRRFTLVAGLLGAAFLVAQFAVPAIAMLLFVLPTMLGRDFAVAELEQAALWRDQLWYVERTVQVNWRDPEDPDVRMALARVRVDDLSDAGPTLPLGDLEVRGLGPALLPAGSRLWILSEDAALYYEAGTLERRDGAGPPPRSTRPFALAGRPAVLTLGSPPTLATLELSGDRAEWAHEELDLALPTDAGALRRVRAVEAGSDLYLFVELCTDEPERCTLRYRARGGADWLEAVEDVCACASWTPIALAGRPALVVTERERQQPATVRLVTLSPEGPESREVDWGEDGAAWRRRRWRPLAEASRLVLVSQSAPGGVRLLEVDDARVVRSARRPGSPIFGPGFALAMLIPQGVPVLLSVLLAWLLTVQMRRHRVQEYVFEGQRRRFASLWRRALAQVVDTVPLLAAGALPMAWMMRLMSDPEELLERGLGGPLLIFGLVAAALLWVLLVLLAYSYTEGRWGRTPGKWLLGIRVLGTDLRPCGFGRALLRNLLTFVDGFFSFLVGALLVALTESWQRLGDLAARTIVVDEAPPSV